MNTDVACREIIKEKTKVSIAYIDVEWTSAIRKRHVKADPFNRLVVNLSYLNPIDFAI